MAKRGRLNFGQFAAGFGKGYMRADDRQRDRAFDQDRLDRAERMAGARMAYDDQRRDEDRLAADKRAEGGNAARIRAAEIQAEAGRAGRMAGKERGDAANAARLEGIRLQMAGKKEPYTEDPFMKFSSGRRGKDGELLPGTFGMAETLGYFPKGIKGADDPRWLRAKKMAGEGPPEVSGAGEKLDAAGRVLTGAAFGRGYITKEKQGEKAAANLQRVQAEQAARYKDARARRLSPEEAKDFARAGR